MNGLVGLAMRICAALGVLIAATTAWSSDWTRFRGPNGTGVSTDATAPPVVWSDAENIKWKLALPGPGSSSPIVVGQRVFVTCWTGYGTEAASDATQDQLRLHLLCIDRRTGKLVWSQAVEPFLPEDEYGGMFAQHGYASHTPVSDGERVYCYFGKTGAVAFDLQGKLLWKTQVGTESDRHGWGSAASPVLFDDVLIVTASAESEALVGLNKITGEELWRQEAAGFSGTWGTPVLVAVDDQRTDLVLAVPSELWGFDPRSGQLRWISRSVDSDTMCSSAVAAGDRVYVMEGRAGGSICVRAGGSGDVSETHVVWEGRDRNRIGTPVVWDGRVYFFNSGVCAAVDAESGTELFQARLAAPERNASAEGPREGRQGFGGGGGIGGMDYASPVVADGKLYYTTRTGLVHVLQAGSEFKQLATNDLSADGGDFSATPAISDGELFIRSTKFLYCVGQGE